MRRKLGILVCAIVSLNAPTLMSGEPDGFKGAVAGTKIEVLFRAPRATVRPIPLPKTSKLVSLDDLQLIGPGPGHPFLLGHYAVDGSWGIVNGGLQVVSGKNAALQLGWAGDFELEGTIEQSGLGGWFFLFGWDEGRGYALSNVLMRESGSPWFISEFRGTRAIKDRTTEFDDFDWRGEQPFRLTVHHETFSLTVGKFNILVNEPIPGYTPGLVVLGVYDTRYGPKTLRIKSLRWKGLAPPEESADALPGAGQ
jgi:hypothetical protein